MDLQDKIEVLKGVISNQALKGDVLLQASKRLGFYLAAVELWKMVGREAAAIKMEEKGDFLGV